MTLRVLVIEDDPRYRASLETLLCHVQDLTLAASFGTVETALAWLDELGEPRRSVDVVLLDIELPGLSGIEAARRIKALEPALAVIMLTVFEEPKTILQAICAGADGYLLKKISARELIAQIRAIAAGGAPLTAGVARTVLQLVRTLGGEHPEPSSPTRIGLTAREQEVLRGLVRGLGYKQVADELGITIDTVRTHVRALYKKLQVHTVAAAVARAIREGLV